MECMPSPQASRRNLETAIAQGKLKRLRCRDETAIIKLLIWQAWWGGQPRPSQRALAQQLGVSQPYVCRVMQQARTIGLEVLLAREGRRVTLEDLAEARRVTARLWEREPGLFAPAPRRSAGDAVPGIAAAFRQRPSGMAGT